MSFTYYDFSRMIRFCAYTAYLLVFFTFTCLQVFSQRISGEAEGLVIKFSNSITQAEKDAVRSLFNASMISIPAKGKLELYQYTQSPTTSSQREIIDQLKGMPGVEGVEPNFSYTIETIPDDPFFYEQWGLQNTGQSNGLPGADIDLINAWNLHKGETEIVAGVVDTGVDFTHPDLAESIWQNLAEDTDGDGHTIEWINGQWQLDPGDLDNVDDDGNGYVDDLIGWDFINDDNNPMDDNSHGTHIAGVIGAQANNGIGISGISQSVKVMALKAFDENGGGSLVSIIPALTYAREMGANLVNNSWGGESYSDLMLNEISLMDQANQLLIAAAGNDGNNNFNTPIYPASYELENIIAVAATDRNDELAAFSNYGKKSVDLAAPGEDIYSTLPGGNYGMKSGTSMAAPMVSGAVALLWSYSGDISHYQVRTVLLSSVDKFPKLNSKCDTGGRLNLLKSLRISSELCTDWAEKSRGLNIRSLADGGEFIWVVSGSNLYKLSKKECTGKTFNYRNSQLPDKLFTAVAIDQNGEVWLGTREEGIYVSDDDGASWTHYNEENVLESDEIRNIFVDPHNTKWIAAENFGVMTFNGTNWQYFDRNRGLPDDDVKDVVANESGKAWAATNRGIGVFNGSGWFRVNTYNSRIPTNDIVCVAIGPDGSRWFGTNNYGMLRFDGSSWTNYTPWNSGLPDDDVNDIAVDEDGIVWVGTDRGMARFDGTNWMAYNSYNSPLPHSNIKAVLIDKYNNAWAGTRYGLHAFTTDVVASFATEPYVCLNTHHLFQNASLRADSYEWTLNGTVVSTDEHFVHTFTSPGFYTLTLKASNQISDNEYTKSFQVSAPPELDMDTSRSACADAIVLDVCRDDLQYEWFNQNNELLSTERYLTVRENGKYTVMVKDGCNNKDNQTVNVQLDGGCVWPGDVDADGKVDMLDFLALGLAQDKSGFPRISNNINWEATISQDWPSAFPLTQGLKLGINHKHADCDGDGTIDVALDGAVVKQNANFRLTSEVNDSDNGAILKFNHVNTQSLGPDLALVEFDVELNAPEKGPLGKVYGMGVSLDFNLPVDQEPVFDATNSWMGDVEVLMVNGWSGLSNCTGEPFMRLDLGITRKDKQGVSGEGSIGILGIIVAIDDIAEDLSVSDYISLQVNPKAPTIINPVAELVPVNQTLSEVPTTVNIPLPEDVAKQNQMENLRFRPTPQYPLVEDFLLFPNPALDEVALSFFLEEDESDVLIEIRDLQGILRDTQTQTMKAGPNQVEFDTSNLRSGLYFVNIRTATQLVAKRMWVGTY